MKLSDEDRIRLHIKEDMASDIEIGESDLAFEFDDDKFGVWNKKEWFVFSTHTNYPTNFLLHREQVEVLVKWLTEKL